MSEEGRERKKRRKREEEAKGSAYVLKSRSHLVRVIEKLNCYTKR